MRKYMRKPTPCLCWQWTGSLLNPPRWLEDAIDEHRISLRGKALIMKDCGIRIEAYPGDWVVKEHDRGIIAVPNSAFGDMYEEVPCDT